MSDENVNAVITNHMEKCKEYNAEEGLKDVYFTKFDDKVGFTGMAYGSIEGDGQDYNYYTVTDKIRVNDDIYLIKIIMNQNDRMNPDIVNDVEYNFYMCNINNRLRIVFSKERIPKRLYKNIDDIPNRYDEPIPNLLEYIDKQGNN